MDETTKRLICAALEWKRNVSVGSIHELLDSASAYERAHPTGLEPAPVFTPEQEARVRAMARLEAILVVHEAQSPAVPDTVTELRAACAEWAEHHGRIMLDPSPAQVRLLKALDADRAACAEEAGR